VRCHERDVNLIVNIFAQEENATAAKRDIHAA
jgi:hypothetical protein